MSAAKHPLLPPLVPVVALILAWLPVVHAAVAEVPFVAGFERFARHGEIDEESAGRLLLEELSCTACHAADPEGQSKGGPILDGVGRRLNRRWLSRFLSDPQKVSPGTTMPAMLDGLSESEREEAVSALVAFLSDQRKPFPEIKATASIPVPLEFWKHGQLDRGRQLYHQIGCVACHEADESYATVTTQPSSIDQLLEQLDPDELEELGLSSAARRVPSVPHENLAAKYTRRSLTYFLLDPHSIRPSGRMPKFKLSVGEASDLAAWLLRDQPDSLDQREGVYQDRIDQPDSANRLELEDQKELLDTPGSKAACASELIAEGARLYRALGCVNCHILDGTEPTLSAKPLSDLRGKVTEGCVTRPEHGRPYYSVDDAQFAAIESALTDDASNTSSEHLGPTEHSQFLLLQLNCYACHERDGMGSVGRYRKAFFETYDQIELGDEGRLPPPLTHVGRKLKATWMTKVLSGSGAIRPHMRIRMPAFPEAYVEQLPELLAQADTKSNEEQPTECDVFGDQADLAEAGRLLLDTGCVQCHPIRGEALPGVVGVDLAGVTGRVNPQWFDDFLRNPVGLKRRTRMPTFFQDGKSQNKTILDGNTDQQIAAIWAFLKDANRRELPPKLQQARQQDYELIPKDRPIMLRTFMEEAGTHAIAVGFPDKIHFAFDAEGLYPAFAWKGRFLDARGTWFERFTPPAVPLDGGGVFLPRGVSLAVLGDTALLPSDVSTEPENYRYLGHRVDQSGVPTFRYVLKDILIEDRLTPTEKGLTRILKILPQREHGPISLSFLAHSGIGLRRDGPRCSDANGLTVTVPPEVADGSCIIDRDVGSEWHVPVQLKGTTEFEVRYEW